MTPPPPAPAPAPADPAAAPPPDAAAGAAPADGEKKDGDKKSEKKEGEKKEDEKKEEEKKEEKKDDEKKDGDKKEDEKKDDKKDGEKKDEEKKSEKKCEKKEGEKKEDEKKDDGKQVENVKDYESRLFEFIIREVKESKMPLTRKRFDAYEGGKEGSGAKHYYKVHKFLKQYDKKLPETVSVDGMAQIYYGMSFVIPAIFVNLLKKDPYLKYRIDADGRLDFYKSGSIDLESQHRPLPITKMKRLVSEETSGSFGSFAQTFTEFSRSSKMNSFFTTSSIFSTPVCTSTPITSNCHHVITIDQNSIREMFGLKGTKLEKPIIVNCIFVKTTLEKAVDMMNVGAVTGKRVVLMVCCDTIIEAIQEWWTKNADPTCKLGIEHQRFKNKISMSELDIIKVFVESWLVAKGLESVEEFEDALKKNKKSVIETPRREFCEVIGGSPNETTDVTQPNDAEYQKKIKNKK
ncbi:hypothetical protein CAEBREN_07267 [Caenorhabditis brenneri]|uniref:SPK domain-containing protein n=1 Tax=Caenorhabditis brenneri TaxID=135651 RepID=G0ME87_CAEBE|nr:hypothetical protein CAEBREN_07267 [Caenorhabditis brenneri]